jgi:hypothetical protein
MSAASRWNEGKVHLGHVYAADPGLETARRLVPGGLRFKSLVEELLGCAIDPAMTQAEDLIWIHRDSVVDPPAARRYFDRLTELIAAQSDGACGAGVEELSAREIESLADPALVRAGFRVPEYSVATEWIADRFVEALGEESRVSFLGGTRVSGVAPASPARGGASRWRVDATTPVEGEFDVVVNALWENRLVVDESLGMGPERTWTHRYRVSLFARPQSPTDLPGAVVAVGPFGDFKNYGEHGLYLSWYSAGLLAHGSEVRPPQVPAADEEAIAARSVESLAAVLPPLAEALREADVRVRGGWVFAIGGGSLADPSATLHRRDRFGIEGRDGYFSVNTGKYSTAPWLALALAEAIDSA